MLSTDFVLLVLAAELFVLARRWARRRQVPELAWAAWKCAWGALAFALAEAPSLVHRLTPSVLATLWTGLAFALAPLALRAARSAHDVEKDAPAPLPRAFWIAATLLLAVTLATALVAPPNTWDALVYHHPRVLQWLAHGSVEPYATTIDRQIRMPVLASYMRLPLQALAGSGAAFNLLQWLFLASAAVEAALLARGWAGASAGTLAGLFVLTLPTAVLQSSGSGNDLIAGGYALSALLVLHRASALATAPWALLFGASLGLCAATKGTGYLLATLLWLAAVAWRPGRTTASRAWALLLAAMVIAAFNLPQVRRTARVFGRPLPHMEAVAAETWTSGEWSLRVRRAAVQIVRSGFLQLDLVTRTPLLRDRARGGLRAIHERLGVALDDAATTFWPTDRYFETNEDTAGNTLHFILALLAIPLAFAPPTRDRRPAVVPALILGWAAWAALAVAIKWMPWNARLQLPALLLLAAPTASVLAAFSWRRTVVALMILGAVPYALWNATRPLLPFGAVPSLFAQSRWENLYRARPEQRATVERIVAALPAACSRERPVGLKLEGNDWEYPFWERARLEGRALVFHHLAPGAAPIEVCATIRTCAVSSFCLE
jgi:hypothetical protein